jgi:hypothetical protein
MADLEVQLKTAIDGIYQNYSQTEKTKALFRLIAQYYTQNTNGATGEIYFSTSRDVNGYAIGGGGGGGG